MNKNEQTLTGTLQTRTCSARVAVETRSEQDGVALSRVIEGCAVRFGEWSKPFWDEWVEQVDPRAFDECDTSDVVMCPDHSRACADVLARKRGDGGTLEISIDTEGLHFRFEAPNTTAGNDLLELVRRGDISECSFSFVVEEDRWEWKNTQNRLQYNRRTLLRIQKLYDLALVVSPQYDNTTATAERAAYDRLRRSTTSPTGNLELARERDYLNNEELTFNR